MPPPPFPYYNTQNASLRLTGDEPHRITSYLYVLLLLLLTAILLSLEGNSDKTNNNKYTQTKKYKNTVQTIQNTVNRSTYK
jgi:hypothetical protein